MTKTEKKQLGAISGWDSETQIKQNVEAFLGSQTIPDLSETVIFWYCLFCVTKVLLQLNTDLLIFKFDF